MACDPLAGHDQYEDILRRASFRPSFTNSLQSMSVSRKINKTESDPLADSRRITPDHPRFLTDWKIGIRFGGPLWTAGPLNLTATAVETWSQLSDLT
jgi:hypothetical protein